MFKSVKLGLLCVYAATGFSVASGQSNMQGSTYGGQQPISGAHVYLFSPAAPLGSASQSLITAGPGTGTDATGVYVTTDANGNFSINQVQCPSANVPEYAYASMGNAGYGSNSAIALMAYVGLCGTQTTININEATTVATAYAVAGYATDPLHISYSGSSESLTGIQNAFANAANLANMAAGTAYTIIPSGYAKVPQATIYTIADALASCINETSQGSNTSNCAKLFNATSVNGVAPTDTATAVMNIAHNPASSTAANIQNGTNIANILLLAQLYQQFVPILPPTPLPNDLTLGLTFPNGGIAEAFALAIDGSGNAWIASQPPSNSNTSSVVEIASPTNMQLSNVTYPVVYTPSTGAPFSIAVDKQSQNIWIGTTGGVEEFSNTGVPNSESPFLTNNPVFGTGYALNVDSGNNVWIGANSSVYELSSSGALLSGTNGFTLPAGAAPTGLALDSSNNVWITDAGNNDLIELNPLTTQFTTVGGTAEFDLPNGVAINANNNKWAANLGNNNFTKYAPTGTPQLTSAPADTPPPSSNVPYLTFVGIDGAGNSWLSLQGATCDSSNSICPGVAEVSGEGIPLSGPGFAIEGLQPFGTATANATAIDGSGDVWIVNTYAQTVTELVGAAAPVVTPLVLAVSNNKIGARP